MKKVDKKLILNKLSFTKFKTRALYIRLCSKLVKTRSERVKTNESSSREFKMAKTKR